jgi:hypothetical protein
MQQQQWATELWQFVFLITSKGLDSGKLQAL